MILAIVSYWNTFELQIRTTNYNQVIVLVELQSRAMCKDWFEEDGPNKFECKIRLFKLESNALRIHVIVFFSKKDNQRKSTRSR